MGTVGLVLLADDVAYAQNAIPSSIVEKSNQFIISKVGQDLFDKYIKIDYNRSTYCPPDEYIIEHPEAGAAFLQRPYYLMVYSFKMPEKTFVDGLIEFAVDTDGNVIPEREVMGIPDPTKCNFPIDEAEAIRIAKNAGLEEGIADWKTSFHWYAEDLKTYVWTVQNTLSTPSGQGYSAGGKGVTIDANSGEVIQNYQWFVQPEERTTSPTSDIPITLLYMSIAIVMPILAFATWRIVKRKNKHSAAELQSS
jgi:hypothetical protein